MRLAAIIFAASAAGFAAAAPASPQVAQQPPQAQSAVPAKKSFDPNEMVCEKQAIPGSRLAVARVCHTRAEWADLRSQDRQEIDRVQTRRGMQDH